MPDEYKYLFHLKNPQRAIQAAKDRFATQSCFVDGFYVTIAITDADLIARLMTHDPAMPLVA